MSKKISELPDAGALTGGDELIPIVQDGDTVKTTVQDIADYAGSGAIWGSITGTLSAQTDLDTALNGKVDKVTGKGLSANDLTNTLKTKLDGIEAGAQVNVNADWNAVSGDAQILNKPTIPSAVTNTSDLINDGSDGVNPFITALDIPTAGQAGTLVREVKNMTGSTLTKGTVVYISGANGNKALVSKARANAESTSARTFGLLQSDILNNGTGYCVVIGDISGLDTSAFSEGAQLYLSGAVAGEYTSTKTLAPTHLVYVGKVTRSHPTQGQIEVQIQNGYELDEIHDVAISSVANNQTLVYESATTLWKNKALTTAEVADSTNKRYVTDANLTVIGNTSGTNSGNETASTIGAIVNGASSATPNDTDLVTTVESSVVKKITWTSIKAFLKTYFDSLYVNHIQGISYSAVTGTTAETLVGTLTAHANFFSSSDSLRIIANCQRSGTTGTAATMRIKVNSANNFATATTIATIATTNSAQSNFGLVRENMIIDGGNLIGYPFGTSALTDNALVTITLGSIAVDVTQPLYFFVSLANASTTESNVVRVFKISR